LRLAERTLALVAFRKPFHNAVAMELLATSLASLLWELTTAVDDIEADGAFLNS
jgi:hypothetical protein